MRRSSVLLAASLIAILLVPASPATAVVVSVPRRIPRDCSSDVTKRLNLFFRGVPDGTAERPTVIRFPARACYRVNGTLRVQGRNWLRFVGSADAPATFRATRRGRRDFQGLSQRRHWWIVNSNHIQIRNIGIRSTNTRREPEIEDGRFARYDARYEFEHGFDISGGSDVRILDVTVRGVWGDCVALNPAIGRRFGGASTTGDRIVRLRCSWNGRQGISVVDATNILIDHVRIANSRRAGIDLEPNSLHNVVRGVEIRNSYTNTHLLAFAASGRSEVSDVWIHHNVIAHSGVPILYMSAADNTRRYDWTFSDNTLLNPAGSPAPALLFRYVTNASVERNIVPVVTTQSRIAVAFEQGLGTLRVADNNFLDGGCYIRSIDSVQVESSGNLLGCP